MARVRFKEILLLLPLLLVWLMFQISHYNKRTGKLGEMNDHNFDSKSFNSTNGRRRGFFHKAPVASKLSWMPPEVMGENYDDEFPEFWKPTEKNIEIPRKLWFMKEGSIRPEQIGVNLQNKLWPEQNEGDRIVEQLMYSPKNYLNEWNIPSPLAKIKLYDSRISKLKKILLVGDFTRYQLPPGRSIFWQDKCPVNTCSFASGRAAFRNPDVIIFKGKFVKAIDLFVRKRPDQVWILYLPDPSLNEELEYLNDVINWTASYRRDSDIVTPYGKFVPYATTSLYTTGAINLKTSNKNYAAHKSRKVAWFVSNCNSSSIRLRYARILSQHIELDIYGSCGTKGCNYLLNKKCLELLDRAYKFYLSFEENSCREYITEVFFEHGLGHNVLPIVMGPPREDYERIAPPHSFIHVDDFATPKELADYLHVLDSNDTLYNEYFNWKSTGELVNTHFWCRLCALLHSPPNYRSYEDIQKWWSRPGNCEN